MAQQGGFPTGAAPDLADAAHIEPGPEDGPTGTQNVDGDEVTEAANTPADDDQAEEKQSFTPRDLAMIAAFNAGGATRAAVKDPRVFDGIFGQLPGGERVVELFAILDESPDLPAEAIVKFLDQPDMPIEAAEAFKACYVGMAAWVKAENVRLATLPASTRPSRYEKHGREERVGAKIVDQAEKDRIARNQAGLAIGEAAAFDDQGKE
ncbi:MULTISPECIES: hypothetical protein [unclassified Mesorhizobium]|uniref:hypothetical protein n=2 Tax=Mesorhizobium TaxID=68287 RepID=UPI000FCA975D|nr:MULTISPECIES: hypothetical protein [unclassified Mesorhizobium]RUV57645.1 hypothetical protein EOA85_15540 [Mesorhizobium sp. M5C.F.Ca.IN.020.29.1.1]TIM52768.1 MAG: hypothetical protein E5Y46_31035 [Mesorhizobium sp.]